MWCLYIVLCKSSFKSLKRIGKRLSQGKVIKIFLVFVPILVLVALAITLIRFIFIFFLPICWLYLLCFLAILFLSQFCCKNVWFDSYGISFQQRNFSPFFSVILIAAVTNLLLCYYNFQNAYKEIKEMIFKYRQKHRPQNCSVDTGEEDSFPEDLYWHVIDDHRVLPIIPEFYRMLRKMALILIFVFLAFCSAILFSNPRDFGAAHLTIYLFATGAIAGLVFKGMTIGKRFTGERKQKMKKQIEN